MKLGRVIAATAFLFCLAMGSSIAAAAVKVVPVTTEYTLGDGESQNAALKRAIAKARRQAELQAVVYVESYTHKDMRSQQDEIDLITGQIVSGPEDLQTEWFATAAGDAHVKISAMFKVDTGKIAEALQKRSQQSLDLYKDLRKNSQQTEAQAERLKQSARQADSAERQKIREKLIANEHRFLAEEVLFEGNALFVEGKYQQALDCYRRAAQIDPTYCLANYNSAVCYVQMGKYDQALAEFGQATRQDPIAYKLPYYKAYIARGDLNSDLDRYEAALADYGFVIDAYKSERNITEKMLLGFDCMKAYHGRALLYRKRHDYALAIADYEAAAKAGFSVPYLTLGCGAVYIDMQEYDRAIEQFNKLLAEKAKKKNAANRALAYFYRGNAYYHKGNYLQAAADYGNSLALDPEDAAAYANRAAAYIELQRYQEAETDAKKAVSLTPANALYKQILAKAQMYKSI